MIRIALMLWVFAVPSCAYAFDYSINPGPNDRQEPVHIPQTYEMRNEDYSDIERNAALNQIENDLRAANTMRLYGIR